MAEGMRFPLRRAYVMMWVGLSLPALGIMLWGIILLYQQMILSPAGGRSGLSSLWVAGAILILGGGGFVSTVLWHLYQEHSLLLRHDGLSRRGTRRRQAVRWIEVAEVNLSTEEMVLVTATEQHWHIRLEAHADPICLVAMVLAYLEPSGGLTAQVKTDLRQTEPASPGYISYRYTRPWFLLSWMIVWISVVTLGLSLASAFFASPPASIQTLVVLSLFLVFCTIGALWMVARERRRTIAYEVRVTTTTISVQTDGQTAGVLRWEEIEDGFYQWPACNYILIGHGGKTRLRIRRNTEAIGHLIAIIVHKAPQLCQG